MLGGDIRFRTQKGQVDVYEGFTSIDTCTDGLIHFAESVERVLHKEESREAIQG